MTTRRIAAGWKSRHDLDLDLVVVAAGCAAAVA